MEQIDMFPDMTKPEEKRPRRCYHANKCLHGFCLNKRCQDYRECFRCNENARMLLRKGWK